MITKSFASSNDTKAKEITFEQLSEHGWAFTAEGDPNTGVVIGKTGVLVIDTQATPTMANEVLKRIRTVTDKPVTHVVLSHYHAVRVLGASAYGAREIIASETTRDLIVERGAADWKSEFERFPRLFRGAESIPGLTWPTTTFGSSMTLWMDDLEIRITLAGRGHTAGDTIVWLPQERVLYSGDLVEYNAGIYTGDAHLGEWPATLEHLRALRPEKMVPGRGPALKTAAECEIAIDFTRNFIQKLLDCAKAGVAAQKSLKDVYRDTRLALDPAYGSFPIYDHCMPFDVSRAFDEASGISHPRIWTAERDLAMWTELHA